MNSKETSSIQQKLAKTSSKKENGFLNKLFSILEENKFEDIISWTLDGKKFEIKNPETFVSQVLTEHFNRIKYPSFTRQLSWYKFINDKSEQRSRVYYHQYFLKGRRDLLEKIMRSKGKSNSKSEKEQALQNFSNQSSQLPECCQKHVTLVKQIHIAYQEIQFLRAQNCHLNAEINKLKHQLYAKEMAIDTYYNDSDLPNCNRNDAIESYKALEPLENYIQPSGHYLEEDYVPRTVFPLNIRAQNECNDTFSKNPVRTDSINSKERVNEFYMEMNPWINATNLKSFEKTNN